MNYEGHRYCQMETPEQFGGSLMQWPMSDINWSINSDVSLPNWTMDGLQQAISAAWSGWSRVCNIRPAFSGFNRPAHITIAIRKIDGPGQVLADCQLPNGDPNARLAMRIDQSESYVNSENPPDFAVDLVRVTRHELGHGIGISHIQGANLMAPVYSAKIADCQVGDIAEAVARYGKPSPNQPPPVEPPSQGELRKIGEVLMDRSGVLSFKITEK